MTLWYDYTTSLRASSRNGIAATEWLLGTELAKRDDRMRAFAFVQGEGLVEIGADVDLVDAVYARPDLPLAATAHGPTSWRSKVRAGLLAILGPSAIPLIQAIASARASVRQRVAAARRPFRHRSRRTHLRSLVRPGDVVVTMGADWSGQLLEEIGQLKQESGCMVAVMVYDLIPLTHTHLAFHKDRDLFQRYYDQVLSVADVVTCISATACADLTEFARARGRALPRAEVLHLGDGVSSLATADPNGADREPFVLWVGTLERRKNFELIYDALRLLETEGRRLPTVVVVGHRGWGVDDVLAEIELGTSAAARSLVLLGSVPDATLDSLYRRAGALVFPSHYEGWGLPLREAAVRGCPVAAADTSASREALAGYAGAVFLSPDDPAPWADYLAATHRSVAPAAARTWSDAASDLSDILISAGERPVLSPDR